MPERILRVINFTGKKLKPNALSRQYQQTFPSIETHLVVVKGASHQEVSTQVRQQEKLVGASLLRSIRTNRSSYVNAKDLIRCWRN